jgi:hypothetical protein
VNREARRAVPSWGPLLSTLGTENALHASGNDRRAPSKQTCTSLKLIERLRDKVLPGRQQAEAVNAVLRSA